MTGRPAGLDLRYIHIEWKWMWNNDWTACRLRFKVHTHWMKANVKAIRFKGCYDKSYCYYCACYEIYFQSEIAFGYTFVFAFYPTITRPYDIITNQWRRTIRLHYCPIIVRTFPSLSEISCNFLLKHWNIQEDCAPPLFTVEEGLCPKCLCPGVSVWVISVWGVSVQRGLCHGDCSPCGQTDACENITLP